MLLEFILPKLQETLEEIPPQYRKDATDRLKRTVNILHETLSPITVPMGPNHPLYKTKPTTTEAITKWLNGLHPADRPTTALEQMDHIIQACQKKVPSHEETDAMADLLRNGIVNARLSGDTHTLNTLIGRSYDWLAVQLREAAKIPYEKQ